LSLAGISIRNNTIFLYFYLTAYFVLFKYFILYVLRTYILFLKNYIPRFENNKIILYVYTLRRNCTLCYIKCDSFGEMYRSAHTSTTHTLIKMRICARAFSSQWIGSVLSWLNNYCYFFFIEPIKLKSSLFTLAKHRYASAHAFKRNLVHTTWSRFELAKKSQIAFFIVMTITNPRAFPTIPSTKIVPLIARENNGVSEEKIG